MTEDKGKVGWEYRHNLQVFWRVIGRGIQSITQQVFLTMFKIG